MNPLLIRFRRFAKATPPFAVHRSDWSWEWDEQGGWLDVGSGVWKPEDYRFLNLLIERGLLRSYSMVRRFDREHFALSVYV